MTDRERGIIRDLLTIISDVQRVNDDLHDDKITNILDCGFAWNTLATAREITEGK